MQILQGLFCCKYQLVEQSSDLQSRQGLLPIHYARHIERKDAVHIVICHCTVNQVILSALIHPLTIRHDEVEPLLIRIGEAKQTALLKSLGFIYRIYIQGRFSGFAPGRNLAGKV